MVSLTYLDTVEVATGDDPKRSIVWLHGLGADGHDFVPIVAELDLGEPVRFIFPHAPVRPVTVNGGMRMRAWYDIVALGAKGPEDEGGVRASAAAVAGLLDREISRGIPAHDIVIAGFSQGGAIALHLGLREPRALAGILVLSSYLPLAGTLQVEKSPANAAVPLLMAHGTADPVVPLALAQASRSLLEAGGYRPCWHTYPMGHTVCSEEIRDISRWYRELPASARNPPAAPAGSPPV